MALSQVVHRLMPLSHRWQSSRHSNASSSASSTAASRPLPLCPPAPRQIVWGLRPQTHVTHGNGPPTQRTCRKSRSSCQHLTALMALSQVQSLLLPESRCSRPRGSCSRPMRLMGGRHTVWHHHRTRFPLYRPLTKTNGFFKQTVFLNKCHQVAFSPERRENRGSIFKQMAPF